MTLKGTGNLPGNFGKTIFTKFGETYFRKILANFRKKFSHMINCQPTDLGGVLYTTELKAFKLYAQHSEVWTVFPNYGMALPPG